jgi:hypothetical protein
MSAGNKEFAAYNKAIQMYVIQDNLPAEQVEAWKNGVPQSHMPGGLLYLAKMYYDDNGNPKVDNTAIDNFRKLPNYDARVRELKGENPNQRMAAEIKAANAAAVAEAARKDLANYESQAKSIDTESRDVKFPVINANTNNVGLYSPDGNKEFGFNVNSGVVYTGRSAKAGGGAPDRYIFDDNRVIAAGKFPMGWQEYSYWIKPDGRIVTKNYAGTQEFTNMFSSKAPSGTGPFQFTVENTSGNLMVSAKYGTPSPVQFN